MCSVMTLPSRYRGFASLDALISLVPLMLIMLLLAQAVSSLLDEAAASSRRQSVFGRTLAVADYTVKIGAARHEGAVRYPNWLDVALLSGEYTESMRQRSNLSVLYIGMDEPPSGEDSTYDVCLYRLVVIGDEKTIGKLHVCGG